MAAQQQEIDLYDWDTSFAIRYADANRAIVNSWASVDGDAKNVAATVEGWTISDGLLDPWQLVEGGDGRNVWMKLPMTKGQLSMPGGSATDLTGAVFECEINLDYVPDPAETATQHLKVDPDGDALNVRNVTGISIGQIEMGALKEIFQSWLAANLGAFNHVFHTLDMSAEIDSHTGWEWARPTAVSYAVTDSGSLDTSVFGVLTMTQNRPKPSTHQVSPNAIPEGCNSGFNLAGPRFTEQMLLNGAALQFEQPDSVTSHPQGSAARLDALNAWIDESFALSNDGMSVTNIQDMTYGTFQDDSGTERTLKIGRSDFKLSVNYGLIEIQFVDLNYEYSPGINVHINYTQHLEVELKDIKDDQGNVTKRVFHLKNHDRDPEVSISKSKEVEIGEIITGIALSIAGAVFGGMAGEAVGQLIRGVGEAAAAGAEATAEGASMAIDASTQAASEAGGESGIELSAQAASEAAAEAAGEGTGKMSGFLARVAPKLVGAMVGAGIGGVITAIPDYIVLAAKGDFDQLPGFDVFADNCISAHTWPNQTGYMLKQVELASAFQIGGDIAFDH